MASSLSINAGQYSEKGIKPVNEDACGILIPAEPALTTKGIAVVIADGVSSSEAGREASEACVQGFLADYYSTPESWTVKTSGRKVLGALNRWVYGQSHALGTSGLGMATTLSAIVIKSATAHLFHVGDTRIYRLRDNDLECLTRDHQIWGTSEKAFLSRAMGADLGIEIDYRSLPVETGDIFLLSTDGVHEYINDKQLAETLNRYPDNYERACREIITRALEQGSHDNVTCQAFRVERLPDQEEKEFYQHLIELPFPPPLEEGLILDGYKILREMHASSRSQVYLALDQESEKKVVIKTPSVNYEDDAEYIDAFLHEEWAGRRINNPHVMKVLESKRRRSFLYSVTEYIDGLSLRHWMNENPAPAIGEVRKIIEQIAKGIQAFHRQEMIHQDLKPENILIDIHGTVKLVDFGSTKIAGVEEIASPIERGNLLGTVDYAAPEYFRGDSGTYGSDIYSLGAITYEMLTGNLPYGGPLSKRNINRVSYHSAREARTDLPAWLDGTLKKAVNKNPQRRYTVLSEYIYDLTHPNETLAKTESVPLLEGNPVAFWQGFSILLIVLNIVLIYLLSK